MKNALSISPRFKQKHPIVPKLIGALILILAIVFVTLAIQKKLSQPMTDYSYYPEFDRTETSGIEVYSTAKGNDIYGEYVVTSTTKGVICVGEAFTTPSLAYRYPLILSLDESYGEISIHLSYTGVSDDSGDPFTYSSRSELEIGKSNIYGIKSWLRKGYIYVIVKDES